MFTKPDLCIIYGNKFDYKETKYYIVDQTEFYKKAKEYTFENLKPKSKKEQGGIGTYSFCIECNGFLGAKYVRSYKEFAQIAMIYAKKKV